MRHILICFSILGLVGIFIYLGTPRAAAMPEPAPRAEQKSPVGDPEGSASHKIVRPTQNREVRVEPVAAPQDPALTPPVDLNRERQVRELEWYEKPSPYVVMPKQPDPPARRPLTKDEHKMLQIIQHSGDGGKLIKKYEIYGGSIPNDEFPPEIIKKYKQVVAQNKKDYETPIQLRNKWMGIDVTTSPKQQHEWMRQHQKDLIMQKGSQETKEFIKKNGWNAFIDKCEADGNYYYSNYRD